MQSALISGWKASVVPLAALVLGIFSTPDRRFEPPADLASSEILIGAFEQAALTSSGRFVEQSKLQVQRWSSPIGIAIVGKADSASRQQIVSLARVIEALSGLDVSTGSYPHHDGNLRMYFAGADMRLEHFEVQPADGMIASIKMSPSTSFAHTGNYTDRRIVAAAIYVAPEQKNARRRDVVPHELMHALGFSGHTDIPFSSILSPERHAGFTVNDLILIRALYDPAIRDGMPRAAAIATARAIIPVLHERVARGGDPVKALAQSH
jgi:hypothetical protein